MKKKTWFLLLIALGLLALFISKFIISDNEPEEPKDKDNITRERNAQSSNKKEKSETKQVTKRSRNVYKPVTPFVSRSGSAILEIDHGLPEQRINTKAMRYGVEYGLKAAMTLHVVDSTGTPVSGATVRGAFWNPHIKDREFNVKTDMYGDVRLENKCTGDLNFSVTKDGYHESRFRYWFFKDGFDCAKDGRWLPWNPTVEVVLKEKRNPVPMYTRTSELILPQKSMPFGFDCEKGDLVEPYGKGKYSDLVFSYFLDGATEDGWCFTNRLIIATPSGGIQSFDLDNWSRLRSTYETPNEGFSDSIMFRTEATGRENKRTGVFFTKDQYLCFHTEKGDNSEKYINVGKIYPDGFYYGGAGDDSSGATVIFTYYFNPNKNDRNLEFDDKTNLAN